ncbi:universal stress protein [Haloarcula sp. CBA1130]|uniref:universal stress protein n=1 Tax=unclassified Haloarcula TaxID=2624677 RepID=UPI00124852FE|nr:MULTISPECIES: universal stress protein [unclassified Haloarcula]KAA9396613.1 universal stress protein [Haloarcula sp. CBA1130]KAA9397763.1 universal stress protein [Haloarcula sp. CBA1129]
MSGEYHALVPVDEDTDRSLLAARAVESLLNADESVEAVLLNVYEEFEATGEGKVKSEDIWDETNFPESVNAAADHLESAGVSVSKRREHGDPAEEIVAVAEEIDAESIVLSGRKRSPAGKMLFGSVTQSVMLSADCPVMVYLPE